MGITYYGNEKIFKLDTCRSSYILGLADEEGFLAHLYYGQRLEDYDLRYLLRLEEAPFAPSVNDRERVLFYNTLPMEYPAYGLGDYRQSCLKTETQQGHSAVGLTYISHRIYKGKEPIPGLPAVYGTEEECETLEILCGDTAAGLAVTLVYSVFPSEDALTRSVRIQNAGSAPLYLTKALSVCLDMENREFEIITEYGGWARERTIQRTPVSHGFQGCCSKRGTSSHQYQPFMALVTPHTDEEQGEAYAIHFVYSGNFTAEVELDQFDMVRAVMGIEPEDFRWKLAPGETFYTPEAVLTYSGEGMGQMTRNLHDLYRKHLIRGKYRDIPRPVLINNWEATYFDFTTEKLLEIAREASSLGIEMLVMDDGWFGSRNDDNSSLGDWFVNEEKLPGGISYLAEQVNCLGMKLGLWMEPEMISPDSQLYREHPDWAIQIPGRRGSLYRNQYVLDFSRKEIRDYIYEKIYRVLSGANIEYVKWDMNRQLSDLGSMGLSRDCQGEIFHRYVLGVYELQERLLRDFPDILLENCSGGGGRFDPGMLFYSPQIWCSDDTDAIERLSIQEGTAMLYPLSAMGTHVSDCPNHMTFRNVPFETRGKVALTGTFGYELDVTKISREEKVQIREQIAEYHSCEKLIREGDYYRIASYRENHEYDCWGVAAKDRSEALVIYIQVRAHANVRSRKIHIPGLLPEAEYRIGEQPGIYTGAALRWAGIYIERMEGDYHGKVLKIKRV